MSHLMVVKLQLSLLLQREPQDRSKAMRRQIVDITDEEAARRSSGNKQMVDEDDERNQSDSTDLSSLDSDLD